MNKEETDIVEYMLSTSDNPYDPHTEWDLWYAFDRSKGYFSCEYLARICDASDDLSERERIFATNQAIEEILQFNLTGNYIKVPDPNHR